MGALMRCRPSPMAAAPLPRAPSQDWVQNQTTSASAVTARRRTGGLQRAFGRAAIPGAAGGSIGGAISGELIAEFLYPPEIELSGSEIGHGFDAAELIGPGLPQRGQVQLAELFEDFVERRLGERMQNDEPFAL